MIIQNLKKKFLNREQIRGAIIFDFFSPGIPYVIKNSGCEFVIYDMEHGGLTLDKFKELSLQQEEADSIDIDAETKSLGPNAPQIIKGIKEWGQGLVAKGVWSDQDFEEFKVFAATANGINALNKVRKFYGEKTIPTAPIDVDGPASNDELYELVADPKYKTDPVFRRKVEEQFARAFPGKVDTGEI